MNKPIKEFLRQWAEFASVTFMINGLWAPLVLVVSQEAARDLLWLFVFGAAVAIIPAAAVVMTSTKSPEAQPTYNIKQ